MFKSPADVVFDISNLVEQADDVTVVKGHILVNQEKNGIMHYILLTEDLIPAITVSTLKNNHGYIGVYVNECGLSKSS